MKLLQKVNRNYLWYTAVVFLIVSFGLCITLTKIVRNEVDEKLFLQFQMVREQININPGLSGIDHLVTVEKLTLLRSPSFNFKDTFLVEKPEQELEKYRYLTAIDTLNGNSYRFETWASLIPTSEFLWALLLTVGFAMLLLVLGMLVLNQRIAKRVWKPFRQYLDQLNGFSFEKPKKISLSPSDIDEFMELRQVLESFTTKAQSDFNSLKEFTVNASHEMQTPLAIIQARLDDLTQIGTMDPEQARHMQAMQQALSRLSRLNQTLILLTRIENNQFSGLKPIELSTFITGQVEEIQELVQIKNLKISVDLTEKVVIVQPDLLDIAIGNLIGNCIRHAAPGTKISIALDSRSLTFRNEGPPVLSDPNMFFNPFVKGDTASGSLGLGLSLVKKICDHFRWTIGYQYESGFHTLKIIFLAQDYDRIPE
ncbi:MAG: sensor histidine kinase [Porphyromonadaceae bacterium]|nr:MAG: sensor histidine kinase [Porphyromonadaceae bacterium]